MRYVVAILLPPLGMALCGKVGQAIICAILMLTCIGWPVASIWAVLVVSDYHGEQRNREVIRALRKD
ncbi:MAG TPA: YqaE/Pmp3 family membrane protein [Gemmataceae bacterium]|nr:YqaE/Pmp3 family membrane protein [Gemmataceae bacterium]